MLTNQLFTKSTYDVCYRVDKRRSRQQTDDSNNQRRLVFYISYAIYQGGLNPSINGVMDCTNSHNCNVVLCCVHEPFGVGLILNLS